MAEKKHKKPYKPRFAHRLGDLVHFHAFTDPQNKNSYFMCKGYVIRQPTKESPVYKLAVVSVDPNSVLCGNQPDQARKLLGRRIAREPGQITGEPTGMMALMYKQSKWIDLAQKETNKILETLKKKKREEKCNAQSQSSRSSQATTTSKSGRHKKSHGTRAHTQKGTK